MKILACFIVAASIGTISVQPVDARADNSTYINNNEMVLVPAGCFQMGSSNGPGTETPVHEVCLSAFQIGKYEVTQGLWKDVMGKNISHFQLGNDYPVDSISWNDTQIFIAEINQITGQDYRLPTEAEWEYACRSGGKNELYCGGNNPSELAWYDNNGGKTTKKVGLKKANGLGIVDMSGNVDEWTQDWFSPTYYAISPKNNPIGPVEQFSTRYGRVVRGGEWRCAEMVIRSTDRFSAQLDDRMEIRGFRLVHSVK